MRRHRRLVQLILGDQFAGRRVGHVISRRWARLALCIIGLAGWVSVGADSPAKAPPKAAAPVAPAPRVQGPVPLYASVSSLWEPVASFGGHLNGDTYEDVAVVLHRRSAVPGDEGLPVGSRGLAVFFLAQTGAYLRVALAESVLPCVTCLGPLYGNTTDFPLEVEIADRILRLSWIGNADGLVSVRLAFRWIPPERIFALISDEVTRIGPAGGRQVHRRDFEAGVEVIDGVSRPIPRQRKSIADVSASDYR